MSDFQLKNQRRKEEREIALRTEKRSLVNAARSRRRFYGGRFGSQPNATFNELAVGTIAQHAPRGNE